MLHPKTEEEIERIRLSAQLLSRAHAEVARHIAPGISLSALDSIAREFIQDHKAVPAFLGYRGFPHTLCTSVNNIVVHGYATAYEVQDGDVVSVDCGLSLDGFYSDSAYTYPIGQVAPEVEKLLRVTKECLELGIAQAVTGNRVGDISYAVQTHAEAHGYGVIRELCGHGVGRSVHEKPDVPNYGKRGHGPKLIDGLVIAIEPMINLGGRQVSQINDWEISTTDKLPSAHYEHTVVVRKGKPEVLTSFELIEHFLTSTQSTYANHHGETSVH